jgi:hypothetical protein
MFRVHCYGLIFNDFSLTLRSVFFRESIYGMSNFLRGAESCVLLISIFSSQNTTS